MAEKTGFILHYDMLENLKLLGDGIALEVLSAISKYDQGLEIDPLSPQAQFAFNAYIPTVKKAKKRWETNVINGTQHKNEPNDNPDITQPNPEVTQTVFLDGVTVTDTVNVTDKETVPVPDDSVFLPLQTFPNPDKPSPTREDATAVFQKVRALWNELGINPQCREIIIPPAFVSDCLQTFQYYSRLEIENAIKNYHYHVSGKGGEGWARPPPYGSIYGFLKTGVARYYDDKAFEQQFREVESGIRRKQ